VQIRPRVLVRMCLQVFSMYVCSGKRSEAGGGASLPLCAELHCFCVCAVHACRSAAQSLRRRDARRRKTRFARCATFCTFSTHCHACTGFEKARTCGTRRRDMHGFGSSASLLASQLGCCSRVARGKELSTASRFSVSLHCAHATGKLRWDFSVGEATTSLRTARNIFK